MLTEMGKVATECLKHPREPSVWSTALGKYVVPSAIPSGAADSGTVGSAGDLVSSRRIDSSFKLILLTSAAGTLIFTALCVGLHLVTSGEPPPAMEKLISGMFDLVKIGFGAIVGLLGSKAID